MAKPDNQSTKKDHDWGVSMSNGADRGPVETLRAAAQRVLNRR